MRAVVMTGYGGLDVLRVVDIADPVARAGEVIVAVRAASVNSADSKVRSGTSPYDTIVFPHVLGRDFSGEVAESDEASGWAVGDEVFGVSERGADGAQAERIAISAEIIARKPDSIDHAEAAAVALTGITAIYALEDAAGIQPGQSVLIQGGGGGVGSFATQLARHRGAEVVVTASPSNHEYARSLGADEVIDYHTTDFTLFGRRFDVVLDTVGGDVQRRSSLVVRNGGKLVVCAAGPEVRTPSRDDISVIRPEVRRDRAHLDRVSELVRIGAVRPPSILRLPFEGITDAHRISGGRHLRGKIVLEPDQSPN